jgi:hypothetical protein
MQAAETSPVSWHGRTLLVETVSGNTPGVYPCCTCSTFGCTANASAAIGYADCSQCTCPPATKAKYGSCAPEFFRLRDFNTLEVLVSPIPGTEGMSFASAFVHGGRLWVYGTGRPLANEKESRTVSCFSSADPTNNSTGAWTTSLALTVPVGYTVFNTDVWAVDDCEFVRLRAAPHCSLAGVWLNNAPASPPACLPSQSSRSTRSEIHHVH